MTPPLELVNLSRRLGLESRELAILAEGNTSCLSGSTFWVKASGQQLATIDETGFVNCQIPLLVEALDRELSDTEVAQTLLDSRVAGGPKPSVEAFMHAWFLSLPGVQWVGHVHPTAALAVLCSPDAERICNLRFFPDEVVCCGPATAWVPYVDPGLKLAQAVRDSVTKFIRHHGCVPKVVWMGNHGTIGLGNTSAEVESAILMNDKVCRLISHAGGPKSELQPLSPDSIERIRTRPDEHYRQELLWSVGGSR